jgi:phosphatidylglycerophosphate synthase
VELTLTGLYPVKTAAVFGAILVLALTHLRPHHPFPCIGPANYVTAVRAALVSLVAGLVGEPSTRTLAAAAVAVSALAIALDGLDGWLARRTRLASAFGARFDMEIDALLILMLSLLTWQHGKAGAWVLASGLLRYAFVAAGSIWTWLRRPLVPTVRARAVCVVQVLGLMLALLPAVTPPASARIAVISLAALAYSFAVDILWLWHHRSDL